MPQETNLNISPYFDDFDSNKNYFKVLFKPGYPVQARELTTLQSIIQDQIEKFGNHIFKEGDSITGGGVRYSNSFNSVLIERTYSGIELQNYLRYLPNKIIKGGISGVRAKVKAYLNVSAFPGQSYTLYVSYLDSSDGNNFFLDGETLIIEDGINETNITIQPGETIANTIAQNATSFASSATLSSGVYFIRGYFVEIAEQIIILDPYSITPSYKIGLEIFEEIISSDIDNSLNDNAKGFSNYTAPGADRLKIRVYLTKKPIDNVKYDNFIELMVVRGGKVTSIRKDTQYGEIQKEFATRTYDQSGDFYVIPPSLEIKETLNDLIGNKGVFFDTQLTYNNNTPKENLATYKISPTKAFVQGYEVETISPTFLDFDKPRTSKNLTGQSINYVTGPTFTLNRVSGSPILGISTSYNVSLRDQRLGITSTSSSGKEIGLARVYDFALESGSYDTTFPNLNGWDISLFDIQTYTEISLNQPITLTTPVYIKGKASGAVGFLRYNAANSGIITAYNTNGKFASGESFIFNGIENTRVSVAVTAYSISDIKSLYGIVGSANTFTGDVKQSLSNQIGQVSITATGGGISTVTNSNPNKFFVGITSVGNIVSFSNPGLSTVTYARVQSVSQNSLTIVGVTTVTGICDGALPTTIINPSDFKILSSSFQSSVDNTLYTVLPKKNISSVDLTNSQLTIRRQFDVTITSNSTGAINATTNETFLPFDEERYILIRTDGGTEPLSSDKFVFTNGGTTLTINGLGTNSTAKLIATLRKTNIKSKTKNKNRIKTLIVNNSKYSQSGTGSTTLNDGLSYNTLYGTRVQDDDICLLTPDVTKIYAIYESSSTIDPTSPNLVLTSLNGPTNKTGDLLIGEKFTGQTSNFVGLYVSKVNDLQINYILLNSNSLQTGEIIKFEESGITAVVTIIDAGSNNIVSNFTLDNGQRDTIYDYSRITRNPTAKEPTKKLKIIFEAAEFASSDLGDITTINSYNQFDYCDLPTINNVSVSDIIDIRPRVSNFSSTTLSPLEFLGRDFTALGNSISNGTILASDESILLDYSFYLPRIDKIFFDKNGIFQLTKGIPAETPQIPTSIENALEIATISLPAYMCNLKDASINLAEHKRYRMTDISKLENRIKNLEFYTSLSLLETNTSNLQINDANGLNRFKSGFFVDDFSTTISQLKRTIVKNSIDPKNAELRPTHYTTHIDLSLGSNTTIGIGTFANPTIDQQFITDLDGFGIKRTGRVISLDYTDVQEITQPYATRIENVTPYLVNYYAGTIELNPSSDIWVDTTQLTTNKIELEGNYTKTVSQLVASGFDPKTGYGPVTWGSWNTTWTGENVSNNSNTAWQGNNLIQTDTQTATKTGTQTRDGTRQVYKEVFNDISIGNNVVSTEIIPYMRSRNIEFTSKRLKPTTQIYGFFDGQDVNQYIIPKLVEITMVSGVFQVGEAVFGSIEGGPNIKFRVSQPNHKYGPYNNPTDIYTLSPYDRNSTVPNSYAATSTLLNIDTFSLSEKSQDNFYGYIEIGMVLQGQTSGAQATISNIRLFTDSAGTAIGSFYIPNPNIPVNPHFQSGTKLFRLSSDKNNSQVPGFIRTSAEEKFESKGTLNKTQENILSVRSVRLETQTPQESQSTSQTNTTVVGTTVIGTVVPSNNSGTVGGVVPNPGKLKFVPINTNPNTIQQNTPLNAVQSAYVDILGRVPDSSGQDFWVNSLALKQSQGRTFDQAVSDIRNEISNSFEATSVRGSIATTQNSYQLIQDSTIPGTTYTSAAITTTIQQSATLLLTAAYGGRKPDDAGLAYWENIVSSGQLTQDQAALQIKSIIADQKANGCPNGLDPLAQSFFVESSSGIFVTKIDVFFKSKDDIIPVIIQLRPIQLGLPTEQVYPFSEVVVDPKNINVSDDASVATTITFPSPVYLKGGQYHSLVILSNSNEYTVWISRLGEVDITTASSVESRQTIVTVQRSLGSLFKSQNGSTWTPSQYEDLKFNLYRASFLQATGSINFYNPTLTPGNEQSPPLLKDSLQLSSNQIRVGLGTTVQDTGLTLGNTIIQTGTSASGNYVGSAGTASGTLTITNSGIGYTPSSGSYTYSNVALTPVTGHGRNSTANITISSGVAIAATIANGGTGHSVGDLLTISSLGANSLGRNLRLSVNTIAGINELIIDNVQGDFATGVGKTIQYINNSGITTNLNASMGGNVIVNDIVSVSDGLHIKINHKNHGMHSRLNKVIILNVQSDIVPTKLLSNYDSTSSSNILVADSTNFATFENVGVGTTTPGYISIGNEIISYTGVSSGTLVGITRSIDQTKSFNYFMDDFVYKYELDGVSLRRINKTHNLSDSTVTDSIGLDYYTIKLDMSTNGVDRSVGTSLPKLYLTNTKSSGGSSINATENIQYEIITPIVENITPTGTNINASVRTISATSINGTEISFVDQGFEQINLNSENYLRSPRVIASRVNETNALANLPGNRSFTLNLNLTTANLYLSPIIDLHRIGMIFTSNRVNAAVTNYVTDNRISSLSNDPTAFVYAINPIALETPATSIKIYVSAYVNIYSDIRAFYAIAKDPSEELIYYPFPGYSNLLKSGQIIDISNSDGTSDKMISKTDNLAFISNQISYKDHEFTIDNLPPFRYFSVKLIGTSTNQAFPPRLRDFRTIALA